VKKKKCMKINNIQTSPFFSVPERAKKKVAVSDFLKVLSWQLEHPLLPLAHLDHYFLRNLHG
jgi:hypothetical protein